MYQIRGTAKSLTVELKEFAEETKGEEITKQGYSKARKKIKHEGYISLNELLVEEYYNEEYKKYKDYRLLGVDGSKISLPHGIEIRDEFGSINKNENLINVSWSTVVYDLLNNIAVDSKLNRYGNSERTYVIDQLREMKGKGYQKKDIIVADRGFPSLELFVELREMGYDYVIRYNGEEFLKETRHLPNSKLKSQIIKIDLAEASERIENKRIKELLKKGIDPRITVRIVKVILDNGTVEYLITSLDKKEFRTKDFKKIYNLRWNQEVYFDFQKNVLQVENFSGKLIETILQDYYSRVLVGNIHALIIAEAQEIIDEEVKRNTKLKYEKYKPNRTVSYGLMRSKLYKMLLGDNIEWSKEYDVLVKEAARYKIAVIPNRHFERKKKGNLDYFMTKKRAF